MSFPKLPFQIPLPVNPSATPLIYSISQYLTLLRQEVVSRKFLPFFTITFWLDRSLRLSFSVFKLLSTYLPPSPVDLSECRAILIRVLYRSLKRANYASKCSPTRRSPISRNHYALAVVSVPRNAHSAPLQSSTCRPTLNPRSPTATRPTPSSYTDCPCHDLVKSLGW